MRNHHSLSRSSYGSVKFDSNDEIHELEGTDSLDDLTDIAPMLKDTNKRWSVIEKLDRRYYCRVRSCDDCLHIMNWKCLIATAMLLFFMVLAYEFARLVFFQSLSQISHYDFIVVGAGPSGSLVARRLVDAGARVLLLEAGNATQYDLGGTDYFGGPLTRFDIPLLWPSIAHTKDFRWNNFGDFDPLIAKGLGGCGIHNAMLYVRALREDVIKWNIPGWTWEIVLDIYKKLETYRPPPGEAVPWYRGTNGAISSTKPTYVDQIAPEFVSAATQLGIPLTQDFNDPDDGRHGVGFYEMNIKDGVRSSAAKEFLGPLIKNKVPNFYLEVGATVRRVILAKKFRKKGQVKKKNVSAVGDDVELYSFQAVGIEYEKNGIIHKAFLTRSVTIKNQFQRQPCIVLTAGAIMTPKILMNSGIGPKHALVEAGVTMKVRNENVGKNLQDHPAVGITAYITPTLAASKFCVKILRTFSSKIC